MRLSPKKKVAMGLPLQLNCEIRKYENKSCSIRGVERIMYTYSEIGAETSLCFDTLPAASNMPRGMESKSVNAKILTVGKMPVASSFTKFINFSLSLKILKVILFPFYTLMRSGRLTRTAV